MGTNYYTAPKPPCSCCERPYEGHHIGKSSYGWAWLWAMLPDTSADDTTESVWWSLLEAPDATGIVDEYGRPVTVAELREIVESKRGGQVLTRENIGGYYDPTSYERIGPQGERISKSRHFS